MHGLERILLKLFGNFSLTLVDSHALSNVTLILNVLVGKLYLSFGIMAVMYVPHHLINKITIVWLKRDGKS